MAGGREHGAAGGLDRMLSRHWRIPPLQLSPVAVVICPVPEQRVEGGIVPFSPHYHGGSRSVLCLSLSTPGNSAVSRPAASMVVGRKRGKQKKLSKHGNKIGRRGAAFVDLVFCHGAPTARRQRSEETWENPEQIGLYLQIHGNTHVAHGD